MKKLLTILSAVALGAVSSNVIAATRSFPDVSPDDWFYGDVMNMVDWGVIQGNDDGTFKPGDNVNRAELSAMWNRYDEHLKRNTNVTGDAAVNLELSGLYLELAWNSLDMAEQFRVTNFVYHNHLVSGVSQPCQRISTLKERAEKYLNRSRELAPGVIDQADVGWMMGEFENKYEGCLEWITVEGL